MRRSDSHRRTSRRSPVRPVQTSAAGTVVAIVSVFAAVAAGTAAAIAIDDPHAVGAFVSLVVGAATLIAVPLVASLARRRLVAAATDADLTGLEPVSELPGADRTGDAEGDSDTDECLEAPSAALTQ